MILIVLKGQVKENRAKTRQDRTGKGKTGQDKTETRFGWILEADWESERERDRER